MSHVIVAACCIGCSWARCKATRTCSSTTKPSFCSHCVRRSPRHANNSMRLIRQYATCDAHRACATYGGDLPRISLRSVAHGGLAGSRGLRCVVVTEHRCATGTQSCNAPKSVTRCWLHSPLQTARPTGACCMVHGDLPALMSVALRCTVLTATGGVSSADSRWLY